MVSNLVDKALLSILILFIFKFPHLHIFCMHTYVLKSVCVRKIYMLFSTTCCWLIMNIDRREHILYFSLSGFSYTAHGAKRNRKNTPVTQFRGKLKGKAMARCYLHLFHSRVSGLQFHSIHYSNLCI